MQVRIKTFFLAGKKREGEGEGKEEGDRETQIDFINGRPVLKKRGALHRE